MAEESRTERARGASGSRGDGACDPGCAAPRPRGASGAKQLHFVRKSFQDRWRSMGPQREHCFVFKSPGVRTPFSFDCQLGGTPFAATVSAEDGRLNLTLRCPAEESYSGTDLQRIKASAIAAAKALRQRLHLHLVHMGGDAESGQVSLESEAHAPPVARPGVVTGTINITLGEAVCVAVGRALPPPEFVQSLAAAVVPSRTTSPAEIIFFAAEQVSDPNAKLLLLWGGLGLFCHQPDDTNHDHGVIDNFLLAQEPSIPVVDVVSRGKPKRMSAVRAARDQFAHLAEKNPAGLDAACVEAAHWVPVVRRLFARLLVDGPR